MAGPKLKAATRTQGNNQALKDGTVKPRTCELEFVEVDPLIDAFRRMVRSLEFDVSEMAMTTYITARAHGKKMIGLPIFLMRAFHHGAIKYNVKSGIKSPKDLEGRRVGVNRGYTVTTGLWARSILANQYGVDLSKITWVLSGDEHVAEYRPPANVVPIEKGKKMGDMLAAGNSPEATSSAILRPFSMGTTFAGGLNSATCSSPESTHVILSRSTPYWFARIVRAQRPVVTV